MVKCHDKQDHMIIETMNNNIEYTLGFTKCWKLLNVSEHARWGPELPLLGGAGRWWNINISVVLGHPGLRLAVALDGVQAPLLGSLAALLKILLVVVLCWPEPGQGNIVSYCPLMLLHSLVSLHHLHHDLVLVLGLHLLDEVIGNVLSEAILWNWEEWKPCLT